MRAAYEATFVTPSEIKDASKELRLDSAKLGDFLKKSRGNWRRILDFLKKTPESSRALIFLLLGSLAEKDLHDVEPAVLSDHLSNSRKLRESTTLSFLTTYSRRESIMSN